MFKIKRYLFLLLVLAAMLLVNACGKRQDAYNNSRMQVSAANTETAGATESSQTTAGALTDQAAADAAAAASSLNASSSAPGAASAAPLTSPEGGNTQATEAETETERLAAAITKEQSIYNVDIEADQKKYDGHVDITVGDKYYATQINDWYMNFKQYAGKVVEIEGFYVGEFRPYDFIGRKGPVCPYCQGGYVSFEILTKENTSQFQSGKDWIKVTGILREGKDTAKGPFYYIEVLKLEKMDKIGLATVTN